MWKKGRQKRSEFFHDFKSIFDVLIDETDGHSGAATIKGSEHIYLDFDQALSNSELSYQEGLEAIVLSTCSQSTTFGLLTKHA